MKAHCEGCEIEDMVRSLRSFLLEEGISENAAEKIVDPIEGPASLRDCFDSVGGDWDLLKSITLDRARIVERHLGFESYSITPADRIAARFTSQV